MKKMNKIGSKIVSIVICMTIVFAAVGSYSPKTQAKSLSTLKSEYSEIKSKVSDSESKVSELESQKAEQQDIISALNDQIEELNSELDNVNSQKDIINDDITTTQNKITDLNNQIADLDAQIAQKDQEIDATVNLFCERMKANYVAGQTSIIEIFTSSSDLSSFLNRLEMFKRVTQTDQNLVDKLNAEIDSIKKMQDDLNAKKADLQEQKTQLEAKQADLQTAQDDLSATQQNIIAKSDEVNQKLSSLNYQTQKLQVSISEYNAQMDALDDEITAFLKAQTASNSSSGSSSSSSGGTASNSSTSHVSSGNWIWPVPYSSSYISSTYGYRSDPATGVYKYHSGLDITMSGAYGKNIVATKSGTVLRVVHGSTGYGNYVMIDHGGGYVSLYGHCSSLAVSEGQSVQQGQVIAYIGASGYATGPHVHFEIRLNGDKQNPLNYVSKP
jgi:murein DD-endopeptidase MepM/ murein hydrolase activator NlpD